MIYLVLFYVSVFYLHVFLCNICIQCLKRTEEDTGGPGLPGHSSVTGSESGWSGYERIKKRGKLGLGGLVNVMSKSKQDC